MLSIKSLKTGAESKKSIQCSSKEEATYIKHFLIECAQIDKMLDLDFIESNITISTEKGTQICVSLNLFKALKNSKLIQLLPETLELTSESMKTQVDEIKVKYDNLLKARVEKKEEEQKFIPFKENNLVIKLKLSDDIATIIQKNEDLVKKLLKIPGNARIFTHLEEFESLSGAILITGGMLCLSFRSEDEALKYVKFFSAFEVKIIPYTSLSLDNRNIPCFGVMLTYEQLHKLFTQNKIYPKKIKDRLTEYINLDRLVSNRFVDAVGALGETNTKIDLPQLNKVLKHYYGAKFEFILTEPRELQSCIVLCLINTINPVELLKPIIDKALKHFEANQICLMLYTLCSVLEAKDSESLIKYMMHNKKFMETLELNEFKITMLPSKNRWFFFETFYEGYQKESMDCWVSLFEGMHLDEEKIKLISMAPFKDKQLMDFYLKIINTKGAPVDDMMKHASENIQNDQTILKQAVRKSPKVLAYANKTIRNDKEFITCLVTAFNRGAIAFASDELQESTEFITDLVGKLGYVLEFVQQKHKENLEIVLTAFEDNKYSFAFAADKFKQDFDLITKLAKQSKFPDIYSFSAQGILSDKNKAFEILDFEGAGSMFTIYPHLSKELKADPKIISKALKNSPQAYKYISKELQAKRDIAIEAVTSFPEVFRLLPKQFQEDKEIALIAIKNDPTGEVFSILTNFYNDEDIINNAITKCSYTLKRIDKKLQSKELVLLAIEKKGYSLEYADSKYQDDEDIVLKAVDKTGYALEYASDRLKRDLKVVETAVKNYGLSIRYADSELRKDKNLALTAIRTGLIDPWSIGILEFLDKELCSDKEVVFEAVKRHGQSLKYASNELKENEQIVYAAVQNDPDSIKHAHPKFFKNKEVMLEVIGKEPKYFELLDESLKQDKDLSQVCQLAKQMKAMYLLLNSEDKTLLLRKMKVKPNDFLSECAQFLEVIDTLAKTPKSLEFFKSEKTHKLLNQVSEFKLALETVTYKIKME